MIDLNFELLSKYIQRIA